MTDLKLKELQEKRDAARQVAHAAYDAYDAALNNLIEFKDKTQGESYVNKIR